jgi:hypothetical protein
MARKNKQQASEKFDRLWLKKSSEIEEQRHLIACTLVAMDRNNPSPNLREKIEELHNMPTVLIFRDWLELTYGSGADKRFTFLNVKRLLYWLRSKQVGCKRSLCDIGTLEFPDYVSDILIGMSIEYDEYLENFKAISINF